MSARLKAINRTSSFPRGALDNKTSATAEGRGKKGHFYKPLQKEFYHDGFQYRQIACEGRAAIYEQRCRSSAEPSVSYEVIRIRRREEFQIAGRVVDAAEIYPKAEAWGVDGFTFNNKDAAFVKQGQLIAKARSRIKQQVSGRAAPASSLSPSGNHRTAARGHCR